MAAGTAAATRSRSRARAPGEGGANAGGGTTGGTGSLNASALAAKVDPGIVDITSDLKYQDATAEGTGMVLTSSGLVLTNNHVIDQAVNVSATLVNSGKSYPAKVIGYDSTDDVALLQLVGASGLKTVTLSDSSQAKVGEAVLGLGNGHAAARAACRPPRRAPSRHSTSRFKPATAAPTPPRRCTA